MTTSASLPTPAVARPKAHPKRRHFTPARLGVYAFLIIAAAFFLLPLYVMGITSIKPMEEIRLGNIFALPVKVTFEPWAIAWLSAWMRGATSKGSSMWLRTKSVRLPTDFIDTVW